MNTEERITRKPEDVEKLREWCIDLAIAYEVPIEHLIDPCGEPLSLCLARLLGGVRWAAENQYCTTALYQWPTCS